MSDRTNEAYDRFSRDYDRFVNWENRLTFEMPFLTRHLAGLGNPASINILDAACGTGMHAIALAQQGYPCSGCDLSQGMVEKARWNADRAGIQIPFFQAGFDQLENLVSIGTFDAILCLGNSLPHLLKEEDVRAALSGFAARLRKGGMLIVQNRNFDAVLEKKERWMEPQSHREGDQEWVYLRLYDYLSDGTINFHIVTLYREGEHPWTQRDDVTRLNPISRDGFTQTLSEAGFGSIRIYGGLDGSDFSLGSSGNLVVTVRKL